MRIIIELDSNNQPEIKKITSGDSEQPGTYLSSPPFSALDAGFAPLPMPEIIASTENEIPLTEIDTASNGSGPKGVDAGAYNATQSGSDSNMLISAYQNELTMAVSSGSALNAGIAKVEGGVFSEASLLPEETGLNIFDRSIAISAGEFINA